MGTHEPYWQTNSSFSPPPRWDFRFQNEGLSFGSHEGIQLYGSSTSSNSRESRSWMRGNHSSGHQYVTSDAVGPYFSSPSDISPAPQWTQPTIHDISVDDYGTSRRVLGRLSFSPTMEGTSAAQDGGGSTSSRSDSSDYGPVIKSNSSHRHSSSRRYFMSKLVHPVSFPSETPPIATTADATATELLEFDATTPHIEKHRLSSASSSVDFKDVSEPFEFDGFGRSHNPSDDFKCALCGGFFPRDHLGVPVEL
ncbi:unnamed protein product [Ilex paraguariensis]|uniref:Uncharacterized protein n=1 Tax=Ilex paraguariensis TaxID=185542 RepID=A0ABC8URR6_9AQUA